MNEREDKKESNESKVSLKKDDRIYWSLYSLSFTFPSLFMLFTILLCMQIFLDSIYLTAAILADCLFMGFIVAYPFYKESDTSFKYFFSAAVFSSLISSTIAVNEFILNLIYAAKEKITKIVPAGLSNLLGFLGFNQTLIGQNILFAACMIFFNIPFLIYFFKRDDKKWAWILLYIIPILIYFGYTFALSNLVDGASTTLVGMVPSPK